MQSGFFRTAAPNDSQPSFSWLFSQSPIVTLPVMPSFGAFRMHLYICIIISISISISWFRVWWFRVWLLL